MKNHKKLLISVLAVLLVLALLCAGVFLVISNKLNKVNTEASGNVNTAAEGEEPEENIGAEPGEVSEFRQDEDVINILLIGLDNDYLPTVDARGNADGIVLLSLNKNTEKITACSVLRCISIKINEDTRDMPTRIFHNHGIDFLVDCLEDNFDIKIDNYVMMNYLNVLEVLENAGGIDVEIKATEIEEFNTKMEQVNLMSGQPKGSNLLGLEDVGMKHLNGRQATVYMRLRLGGGDEFARTSRIRSVLTKLKDSVLDMSITELNKLTDVALENMITDMSTKDILALAAGLPKYLKYDLETMRIPIDDKYDTDGSFLFINIEKNKEALHEALYG